MRFRGKVISLPGFPSATGIAVPANVVKALKAKFKGRFQCALGGKVEYSCGLMPLGGGKAYVFLSKPRRLQLGLEVGDPVTARLTPDNSKYGMPVPRELTEFLRQDAAARKAFAALTPGKQRNIIFYVSGARTEDTRIERVFRLLTNLKRLTGRRFTMGDIMKKEVHPADLEGVEPVKVEKAGASISFDDVISSRAQRGRRKDCS